MRKIVSAYEDKERSQLLGEMPCNQVPDPWSLPDDILIRHARSAMVQAGILTAAQNEHAYFAVREAD